MLQQLMLGHVGVLETTFLGGRPSACTCDLFAAIADPSDDSAPTQKLEDAACEIDPVDTELDGAVEAGDDTLGLDAVTDIKAGRTYLLGAIDDVEPAEHVTVKAVGEDDAVILTAPLAYAHADGASFVGIRVTVEVPASGTAPNAGADVVWGGGYATFKPTGEGLEPQTETVDCVRAPIPVRLIGIPDLRMVDTRVLEMLDVDTDIQAGLRTARDEMLLDLGPSRARSTLGTDEFKRPAALKFFLLRRHNFGEQIKPKADGWAAEYGQILARLRSAQPMDANQNGLPNEAVAADGSTDLAGMSATDLDPVVPPRPSERSNISWP